MGIRVGIDTGGTFTDLVAVDSASGRWHVAKVPSNPANPVAAIGEALEASQKNFQIRRTAAVGSHIAETSNVSDKVRRTLAFS